MVGGLVMDRENINLNNIYDLVDISDEKIYMNFNIGDQNYVVLTEDSADSEEFNVMFAKLDLMNGNKILRNIEDKGEYELVIEKFNKRLMLMDELMGDDLYE